MEVHKSHASASWGARSSTDQIPQPDETSIAQRSTPELVLWSDEPGGVLEPAQGETGSQRQERSHRSECSGEGHARASPSSFRIWCICCVQTIHITDKPYKEPEFPIIMADNCIVQDAPGKELCTILGKLNVALGMMAATSAEEKGPATYVVSVVVEHLRAWGRKKVTFRIDCEPAIRALGVAIQYARSEETVVECRPKYSSPSMGPVENMNRRCFRTYLREKAKLEITTESPLLPRSDTVDGSRAVSP